MLFYNGIDAGLLENIELQFIMQNLHLINVTYYIMYIVIIINMNYEIYRCQMVKLKKSFVLWKI